MALKLGGYFLKKCLQTTIYELIVIKRLIKIEVMAVIGAASHLLPPEKKSMPKVITQK